MQTCKTGGICSSLLAQLHRSLSCCTIQCHVSSTWTKQVAVIAVNDSLQWRFAQRRDKWRHRWFVTLSKLTTSVQSQVLLGSLGVLRRERAGNLVHPSFLFVIPIHDRCSRLPYQWSFDNGFYVHLFYTIWRESRLKPAWHASVNVAWTVCWYSFHCQSAKSMIRLLTVNKNKT
jgi:hypothetical protein